jgi:hypothetical protein
MIGAQPILLGTVSTGMNRGGRATGDPFGLSCAANKIAFSEAFLTGLGRLFVF